MKLKLLKKYYVKKYILHLLKSKEIIIFIQYNNLSPEKKINLKKKLLNLSFRIKLLKNKPLTTTNCLNSKIRTVGQCAIIYPTTYITAFDDLIKLFKFLIKEEIIIINCKYRHMLYNIADILKITKLKKENNIIFSFFFNLVIFKTPNQNLLN